MLCIKKFKKTLTYNVQSVTHNSLISVIFVICLFLVVISVYQLHFLDQQKEVNFVKSECSVRENYTDRPVYAVFGRNVNSGYLEHVYEVFNAFGYSKGNVNEDKWNVLWAHDYPFQELSVQLKSLRSYQKVNHFPGTGFITNKLDLVGTEVSYIPKAFQMPTEKQRFLDYASKHPGKMFVQKSNNHRGIQVKDITTVDLNSENTFIQEFISNPLLIDGYKFDIGVYTIITSVEPLRVYMYDGDILFRFCPEKYFPFDKTNVNKYVITDDYRPLWEVPSLKNYFSDNGYSMKNSFNQYLKENGKDAREIWRKVEDAIRTVCLIKEPKIVKVLQRYSSKRNFFEMMRFDFAVDEDLNVFIMEANMSPNLSSAHFRPNKLLYMQVLFNLFSLIGLNSPAVRNNNNEEMEVSLKNLMVFPEICSNEKCNSCFSPECHLCLKCLTNVTISYLKDTYREYNRRQDCKRIFPPPMISSDYNITMNTAEYSPENQLLFNWFRGKCYLDSSWC